MAYWLALHTPAWRDRIRYVAIDMCTVFVSAIRCYLPHATIAVDHFHVVKLANDTVAEVRCRIATQLRGRRGRATDPEYHVRNLLRRNRENLSDQARNQPTPTNTLCNHPPSPRMPQPRPTSMTPVALFPGQA